MSTVTFIRERTKFSGRAAKLNVKLDRQKLKLGNGEERSIEVKPGKHKAQFRPSMGALAFMAIFGYRGPQLKYKFKLEENQDVIIHCSLKGGKVAYQSEFIEH